mmetsp:Transcript_20581/g.48501  ORF Transcript_20581/g.48501 Transcript_20581/m.48501 type:complete len:415 (+) Transcript_20581:89-1333(+)
MPAATVEPSARRRCPRTGGRRNRDDPRSVAFFFFSDPGPRSVDDDGVETRSGLDQKERKRPVVVVVVVIVAAAVASIARKRARTNPGDRRRVPPFLPANGRMYGWMDSGGDGFGLLWGYSLSRARDGSRVAWSSSSSETKKEREAVRTTPPPFRPTTLPVACLRSRHPLPSPLRHRLRAAGSSVPPLRTPDRSGPDRPGGIDGGLSAAGHPFVVVVVAVFVVFERRQRGQARAVGSDGAPPVGGHHEGGRRVNVVVAPRRRRRLGPHEDLVLRARLDLRRDGPVVLLLPRGGDENDALDGGRRIRTVLVVDVVVAAAEEREAAGLELRRPLRIVAAEPGGVHGGPRASRPGALAHEDRVVLVRALQRRRRRGGAADLPEEPIESARPKQMPRSKGIATAAGSGEPQNRRDPHRL